MIVTTLTHNFNFPKYGILEIAHTSNLSKQTKEADSFSDNDHLNLVFT